MDESQLASLRDDIAKTVAASSSGLAAQLIDVYAMVNTLLDLERERLVQETGRTAQDVARSVEAKYQAHRIAAHNLVEERGKNLRQNL